MDENASNPWFVVRRKCPVCASEQFKTIYKARYDEPPVRDYLVEFYSSQGIVEFEYLEGAFYTLCDCNQCHAVFQREIPGDALMERVYEHWIDPVRLAGGTQRRHGLDYYSGHAREITRLVAQLGGNPTSLDFLDFGMGWGEWALMAKALGCNVYGAELSRDRIENAKSMGIKIVTWDEIPGHSFDFINTEQVFEHIPEPLETLRHLGKALKPGGLLKVSVPTATDINRRLRLMDWKAPKGRKNSLNPVAPLEHINFFRRSSLARMAREAGMEEVQIPMRLQYKYPGDWSGPGKAARNIFLPLYRNLLKRQNNVLFRKASPKG
jgi:2-polyprenyl-3-methyl-5-hydroxy-6-metoxy-1,4-benzoquinol methylase